MTFNELIEKAHSAARANGWWDEERNTGELLMLIVSECGEALEAHRNGRVAKKRDLLAAYYAGVGMMDKSGLIHVIRGKPRQPNFKPTDGEAYYQPEWFNLLLKDTFEDELADIVIRIADLLGHMGAPKDIEIDPLPMPDNVGQSLLNVCSCFAVSKSNIGQVEASYIMDWRRAVDLVFGIAKRHNIDLWRHIELKLAYNATRGQKHCKAY